VFSPTRENDEKKSPHTKRHDLSKKTWLLLQPHLPGSSGSIGRPALNNRLFLNAIFWAIFGPFFGYREPLRRGGLLPDPGLTLAQH